jgi:acetylglutamate kinase
MTVVAKLGGNALELAAEALAARDGGPLIVVHGGGAQISELMRRRGIEPRFVAGRRFTDLPTLACVRSALATVSDGLVAELRRLGADAVPLRLGEVLRAERLPELGLAGTVAAVDHAALAALCGAGRIPVLAPLARDGHDRFLNVNADDVAAAVAASVGARELVFLTDVAGVLDDCGEVIPTISAAAPPTVTGGMLPKLAACSTAVAAGVTLVRIGSGTVVTA